MYTLEGIPDRKPVYWMGSSWKALKHFPAEVQDEVGRGLLDAQCGDWPENGKVMRGFGGAAVVEIVDDHDGDTYRAVYTIRFSNAIYVLHCFQKKSKHGIETPRHEIEVIRARLKLAEEHHRENKEGTR
jgi:phage-related protein